MGPGRKNMIDLVRLANIRLAAVSALHAAMPVR